MSGNGAASGEGSTGTQPRPQSRGTPMERELARFSGLTDAGKRDLQEDIFSKSKPDVVSALEKFRIQPFDQFSDFWC